MSLMPKIVRGSAMHVIEQVVRLACGLWITPRMVYYLGENGFGLWGILAGIFSQFLLLDLGLSTSMPRFLARAIGNGDVDDLRRTASTGTLGMLIIGVIAQIAGAITWLSLPWFLSEVHELEEARHVVIALTISSLAFWLVRPILVHLQSQLRRDIIAIAAITRVLLCTVAVAWALGHGKGLVTVAWIHTIGGLGELALMALMDRSFFPLVRWHWAQRNKARELLIFSRWSYLLTTSERISFSGTDIFILAAVISSAASGIYSLGQKFAIMFYDVAYAIVGAQLLSAFSQLDGADDRSGLERGFIAASRISVQVAVIGGGILWAIGPAFLTRWVPQQAAEATPVLLALIFPHVLGAAQIPARHLLISLARHRALALTFLVGIILNILLTYVLVRQQGITGAAIASLVVMSLVYGVAMPWLVVTQVGLSWRTVAWQCLWLPLVRSTVLMAPAFFLARQWLQEATYFHIILTITALSVIFFAFLMLGLLGRDERTWFKMGIQVLFKRNKAAARPPSASP